MRLIDADEIMKRLQRWNTNDPMDQALYRFALSRILEARTVDAVPVVRCKDCKKYIPCQKLPIGTSKWCDLFDRATCEMNYCAWGERREGE